MPGANGTQVASVYFDLQVRDTIARQMQALAAKAQTTARGQFAEVGKAAGEAMNRGMDAAAKSMANTASGAFNKSAAMLRARIRELETSFDRTASRLDALWQKGQGPGSAGFDKLTDQQQRISDRITAMRDRLAIEVQAAAAKQAAAEQAAYAKTAQAAEQTAARQQAAARGAHTTAAPPAAGEQLLGVYADGLLAGGWRDRLAQFSQAVTGSFAGAAGAAEQQAARTESAWSRAFSAVSAGARRAFSALGRVAGAALGALGRSVGSIGKRFDALSAGVGRFARRLGSIVSGALVFNLVSAGLRNVVNYMGQALTASSALRTALGNLSGAAQTAAAPLIQVLTPALTALANAAATVFSYIARLVSFFTGKSVSAMAATAKGMASVGSAASGTAKQVEKATRSLAGFDEIEKLSAPEESGGGSGGGSGSAGDILPNYDFQGKSPFLDSILAAIEGGNWYKVGALVAKKLNESMAAINWPAIDQTAIRWATNLYTGLNGFVQNLNWGLLGNTIGNGLNTALHFIDTFFQGFDWDMLGRGLGAGLSTLVATVDWEALGRVLTDKLKALFETLHGFVASFDFTALGQALATATMAAFNNVNWAQAAADASGFVIGVLQTLTAWVQGIDWSQLGTTVADCLLSIDWAGILLNLLLFIGEALSGLAETAASFFAELANACGEGFLGGILQFFADIFTWVKEHMIDPLVDAVKDLLGIHSPSTVFSEIGQNLVLGLLEGVSGIWGKITDFFQTSLDAIKQKFGDTWQAVKDGVSSAFGAIRDTMASIWNGIADTVRGAVNSIIGFMNKLLSGAASMVNGLIDVLNNFKIDVPDDVPLIGGTTFGFALGHVSAPQIPMLAAGGVIRQPTLAMMGEYAGAGQNPEIVAPQDLLRETMDEALGWQEATMQAGFEELAELLREVRQAIYDTELTDTTVGRAAQRWQRRQAIVTGGT